MRPPAHVSLLAQETDAQRGHGGELCNQRKPPPPSPTIASAPGPVGPVGFSVPGGMASVSGVPLLPVSDLVCIWSSERNIGQIEVGHASGI